MLRENAIYTIYLYLCPPLSKVTCRDRGEGGLRGVWKNVTSSSTFQDRIRSMRNIVGKFSQLPFCRSIEIHPTSICRHFFLSGLWILWECKGILSSKQNHKLKHAKTASTKPLSRIKFIFSTPPTHFRYRYATAYICIYNITQVKYL